VVNKLIKEQQNILVSTSIQPNNYQEVEKSQSERIATVTVKKPDESEVVQDVGRIIGFEQELAESSSDKASITSSILFAGVVALCLGFVIAIFYFMRKKRKDEISFYGADLDTEKLESEKSIYLDDFGENETKDDEEGEIQTETQTEKMQVV